MRGEHLAKKLGDPRAFPIQVLVDVGRELRHRGKPCRHSERVAVVRAALRQVPLAPRIEQRHHVRPAAERGDWKPTADDLAHRREVRRHAVHLLRAAGRQAERDHLVEDEKNAELLSGAPEPFEELDCCRDHTAGSDDRLQDHRGQRGGFAADDRLGGVGVVEGQHHSLLQNPIGRAGRVGPGNRSVGRSRFGQSRVRAHLGVVVGAVIAALHARDLRPPREGPGQPHGEHRRLGARVAEADRVEARHPLT